jgi:hypothetical protein
VVGGEGAVGVYGRAPARIFGKSELKAYGTRLKKCLAEHEVNTHTTQLREDNAPVITMIPKIIYNQFPICIQKLAKLFFRRIWQKFMKHGSM